MKGRRLTGKERREVLESDAAERRKMFKELCRHLACGYSRDCFEWLSENQIKVYIEKFPEEFVISELEDAMRRGKIFWEGVGRKQSLGECMGNSRSWYYNMANRYGWREKVDIDADVKGSVNVNVVSYASTKKLTDSPE